ncbi:helix-turn-helix domain-containing protein [Paraburkholderia xenovorans]|uniref:hypothetical protein n=1 Tax=Paraburkholderia xenovorans TaxID=36873 RepID=UPI0038B9C19F
MKNDWLITEIALLRESYATAASCAELMALFPRHTPGSVRRTARMEGLSRPLAGVVKFRPGLDRVLKLLESAGPMTSREIGERLGIQYRAVENLKQMYRASFRVAGWEPPPGAGKWAPKWGLANGMPDIPKPFSPKRKKIGRKMANPFAIASGQVSAPAGTKGRVYQQSMSIRDDELEAA